MSDVEPDLTRYLECLIPYEEAMSAPIVNSLAKGILIHKFANNTNFEPQALIKIALIDELFVDSLKLMTSAVARAVCACLRISSCNTSESTNTFRIMIVRTLTLWVKTTKDDPSDFLQSLYDSVELSMIPHPEIFLDLPSLFDSNITKYLQESEEGGEVKQLIEWFSIGADRLKQTYKLSKIESDIVFTKKGTIRVAFKTEKSFLNSLSNTKTNEFIIRLIEEGALSNLLQKSVDKRIFTDEHIVQVWNANIGLRQFNMDDFDDSIVTSEVLKAIQTLFKIDRFGGVISLYASPKSPTSFEKDHLFPKALGGLTINTNLVLIHHKCNSIKSNQIWQFISPKNLQPNGMDWFCCEEFGDVLFQDGVFCLLGKTSYSFDKGYWGTEIHDEIQILRSLRTKDIKTC